MGLIMDECGENIDCSLHVGMIRRVSASGGSEKWLARAYGFGRNLTILLFCCDNRSLHFKTAINCSERFDFRAPPNTVIGFRNR